MTPEDARQLLVDIASTDLGKVEVTRNRAPWIEKLWADTTYPDGMKNREPYCAAGMCWVLAEWIRRLAAMGELKATTGMTLSEANRWRCKSPRAFGWQDWAKAKGLRVLPDTAFRVKMGSFMVFDMSHIGLVKSDTKESVSTIEYNTGPAGGNDGDGCWPKLRQKSLAKCFIEII
jgi:hypothetical protein